MTDATLKKRFFEIDVYRGLAIVMMVLFHILYDLNTYHFTNLPIFSHAFWKVYRETISFLFLGLVGFCLYHEHHSQILWKRFWIRMGRLLMAAACVSIGTYIYEPQRPILFGILHFIAAGSLAALVFIPHKRLNFFLGVLILATGYIGFIHEARYRIPYMEWIGFGASTLPTLEIFPFIPFFGYILIGMGMAQITELKENTYYYLNIPTNPLSRFLAFCGKHPLMIYLIHQPILVGIISRIPHST
ncbi:MAG: DUF1624 domain-containing protein [Deltaproteobacteria bacterium]|nr:MAG: DUF1624 domain-containing protein [Deltaproteobacteria bacterium]